MELVGHPRIYPARRCSGIPLKIHTDLKQPSNPSPNGTSKLLFYGTLNLSPLSRCHHCIYIYHNIILNNTMQHLHSSFSYMLLQTINLQHYQSHLLHETFKMEGLTPRAPRIAVQQLERKKKIGMLRSTCSAEAKLELTTLTDDGAAPGPSGGVV